jgi:hypothetical protein
VHEYKEKHSETNGQIVENYGEKYYEIECYQSFKIIEGNKGTMINPISSRDFFNLLRNGNCINHQNERELSQRGTGEIFLA